MTIKKIPNGLKKVNFFGKEIARLEFGSFTRYCEKDETTDTLVYQARIIEHDTLNTCYDSIAYFTDPTHGLIDFTETAKDIYTQ